jgi:hypothetical protein
MEEEVTAAARGEAEPALTLENWALAGTAMGALDFLE